MVKGWLVTGGGVVIVAAIAIAFWGGDETSTNPLAPGADWQAPPAERGAAPGADAIETADAVGSAAESAPESEIDEATEEPTESDTVVEAEPAGQQADQEMDAEQPATPIETDQAGPSDDADAEVITADGPAATEHETETASETAREASPTIAGTVGEEADEQAETAAPTTAETVGEETDEQGETAAPTIVGTEGEETDQEGETLAPTIADGPEQEPFEIEREIVILEFDREPTPDVVQPGDSTSEVEATAPTADTATDEPEVTTDVVASEEIAEPPLATEEADESQADSSGGDGSQSDSAPQVVESEIEPSNDQPPVELSLDSTPDATEPANDIVADSSELGSEQDLTSGDQNAEPPAPSETVDLPIDTAQEPEPSEASEELSVASAETPPVSPPVPSHSPVTAPSDQAEPQAEAPEIEVVESDTSETPNLETQTPEVSAADDHAPETSVPETETPETAVADTLAPETQTPELQAPETQTPETQAPESQAPEPQTPEAEAPETQAVEVQAPEIETAANTGVDEAEVGTADQDIAESTVIDQVVPSFDAVRVNEHGMIIIAGRAEPGVTVVITSNGATIGSAEADALGEFVFIGGDPLNPGDHEIGLAEAGEDIAQPAAVSDQVVLLLVPEPNLTVADTAPTEGVNGESETGALAVLVDRDAGGPTEVLQAPTPPALVTSTEETGSTAATEGPETATDSSTDTVVASVDTTTDDQGGGENVETSRPSAVENVPANDTQTPAERPTVTIDVVDYDDEGRLIIAGRAQPGAAILVYLDNQPIGRSTAAADGRYWLRPDQRVVPGIYTLRADQVGTDGSVVARAETPFQRTAPLAGLPDNRRIVVQPGNNLWRLARNIYGQGLQYTVIYQANRSQIRNPDLIYPGQVFVLPAPPEQLPAGLPSRT